MTHAECTSHKSRSRLCCHWRIAPVQGRRDSTEEISPAIATKAGLADERMQTHARGLPKAASSVKQVTWRMQWTAVGGSRVPAEALV